MTSAPFEAQLDRAMSAAMHLLLVGDTIVYFAACAVHIDNQQLWALSSPVSLSTLCSCS